MGLFNWANMKEMKEGKGVKERKEPPVSVFFGVLQRKLGKFITLNFAYLLAGLPTWLFMGCIGLSVLFYHSGKTDYNWFLPVMLILIPFIAILSGPATMGVTYVLRNFSREQHAWVIGDLFEKASKNYVQGAIISTINSLIAFALVFAYFYYGKLSGGIGPVNAIVVIFGIILASLRSYIYPMAVSYKLKITDLYRYSLAMVIMKFPQNLLLQAVSFGLIYAAFYYPNLGIIISVFGGILFLGYLNIFYTDRVLLKTMDEKHEKIYPEKEHRV